jgi:drug/metabolite transporter (DMT)-like permease
MSMNKGIATALGAAVLFGASTPIAKHLVGEVTPVLLAGLLYTASGLGLAVILAARHGLRASGAVPINVPRGRNVLWLAGAILFGGVLGPVFLLVGLTSIGASVGSLLLNLEAVFTALIAWSVFREHVGRRIALGMGLIVLGGTVLAWTPGDFALSQGVFLVVGACLCWAIDNNLTRQVAASDAMTIACIKGLAAGPVNIVIAVATGAALPAPWVIAAAGVVGLAGYGISLVLFVLALRDLGTARTGAYFSVAPFFGALLALGPGQETITAQLLGAGLLMAGGVWLHVSEQHAHWHEHALLEHVHSHVHDAHHVHAHGPDWDGVEPHSHPHVHRPLRHAHPHFPDIHHRHDH